MNTLFNKTLEMAINSYLALDPESEKRLSALEGKIITIELKPISYNFHLKIIARKINILSELVEESDVRIVGTPISLLSMSLSKDRKKFFADDVRIEGNLELGQQIIDLFDEMEIDWEELLSHTIGDVPSHQLGRLVRGFKDIASRARESLIQNINEYVHEEVDMFPPKEALHDFFNDIDQIRMDADRLEARINRLKNKERISR